MNTSRDQQNIVLIGLSGTGKSSVAAYISIKTGRCLYDVDSLIEEAVGCSINEIFASQGESFFRNIEREVIHSLSEVKSSVIACGGGAVLDSANLADMAINGTVFWLQAEITELARRIQQDFSRPLLVDDIQHRLDGQLRDRRAYYERAVFHINTQGRSIQEVGDEIIDLMQ